MVYDKWAPYEAVLLGPGMGVLSVLHALVLQDIMFGKAGSSKR